LIKWNDLKSTDFGHTLIIPAFNAERYVGQAIQSVLDQTCPDFEIIVVDDGSTDYTAELVRHCQDHRIVYLHQENRGLAGARNTGIRTATGEHIGFLDADDLWHARFLETCVGFLAQNPHVDIIRTGWSYIDSDGSYLPAKPQWGGWHDNVLDRLIVNNVFVPVSAVVRRHCFKVAGLFDEGLRANEDWDLWLRMAWYGFKFDFIAKSLAMYRRHDSNMTLDPDRMLTSRLAVLAKIFSLPNLPDSTRQLRSLAYARVYFPSCLEAYAAGDIGHALENFTLAVKYSPEILTSEDTYYNMACASQPVGYKGTSRCLDLDPGVCFVFDALDYVFASDVGHPLAYLRKKAYAVAHFAMAMLHYTVTSRIDWGVTKIS
jgi:glycosyltransferase involved in cell wall biosynthesis